MKKILIVLFGLNILAWLAVWSLDQRFLEVTFFDVGQGDAVFIETPQGHQILIDGGPSGEKLLEKLGEEMPFWDRTIDLVILTHPEHDHLAGLIEVLKRYKVENILWTGVLRDTAEYEEWQRLIQEEGADIFIAQAGQRIYWSRLSLNQNERGLASLNYIEVLHPFESFDGRIVSNTNNTSIVARLLFGDNSFLFTGDAYQSVERQLLGQTEQLKSDVLKVGHHGSKTSSSESFIKKVSPQIAVIQAGRDNSYGHPHEETLETLTKYGINILRTDIHGDIKIISNGKNYAVSGF